MKAMDIFHLCNTYREAGLDWDDVGDLDVLNKAGKRLHRLYEHQCNGFADYKGNWDEVASDRAEKQVAKLEAKVKAIIAGHVGWTVEINRDPRGWPLKIFVKGARTDISNLVNL